MSIMKWIKFCYNSNNFHTRDAESVSISDIAELVAAALPEEGASK